jgi:hypothetical protein
MHDVYRRHISLRGQQRAQGTRMIKNYVGIR